MDEAVRQLITAFHAGPRRIVLAVTGGGASVAGLLLGVPGGSRTVLDVQIPYSEQALSRWLGLRPASFCSAETTRLMAERALDEARLLAPGAEVLGVGGTAGLRSDRPKRGDHRFHLALADARRTVTLSLTLTKEARERSSEEDVLVRVLLNALAESAGLSQRVAVPLLPGEEVQRTETSAGLLADFLAGRLDRVCVEIDGRIRTDAEPPAALLPGSFNPLHEGHIELACTAARRLGRSTAFEMTVVNADKPPLADEVVRQRLAAFVGRAPLWLTRVPTFVEKARHFPNAVFVVGADTAARIVQPRFYGDSPERMADALAVLRRHGCRFLVAGRVDDTGRFVGLADLAMPEAHRDLFDGLSEAEFRLDRSSTGLRRPTQPEG
jgi:hypothetical protein